MASGDDGCSESQSTQEEPPHVPRTLGDRETKLLADAQRTTRAISKQKSGQLLPKGEDYREITIKYFQAQLAVVMKP